MDNKEGNGNRENKGRASRKDPIETILWAREFSQECEGENYT